MQLTDKKKKEQAKVPKLEERKRNGSVGHIDCAEEMRDVSLVERFA